MSNVVSPPPQPREDPGEVFSGDRASSRSHERQPRRRSKSGSPARTTEEQPRKPRSRSPSPRGEEARESERRNKNVDGSTKKSFKKERGRSNSFDTPAAGGNQDVLKLARSMPYVSYDSQPLSDGTREQTLIAELCLSSHMGETVPPADRLASFARKLSKLNAGLVSTMLWDFLDEGQFWGYRAKALCVMEVAIEKGDDLSQDMNPYKYIFTAHAHKIQPLADYPHDSISDPAKRVLKLLGMKRHRSSSRHNKDDKHRSSSEDATPLLEAEGDQDKKKKKKRHKKYHQRSAAFMSQASAFLLGLFMDTDVAATQQWLITLRREMMAEAIGSFLLVWFGTGAVFAAIITNALQGLFQVASVWIVGVTVAIAATGAISGAHLNPAISFTIALLRPTPGFGWSKVLPYAFAQLAGAIVGSSFNYIMFESQIRAFEAANHIDRSSSGNATITAKCFGMYFDEPVTAPQAFFAEGLGTAILAGVVFALTHPSNDTMKNSVYIPPLIGLTVGGLIGVIGSITQCGMNPARDLGPRIVAYLAGWTSVAFDNAWLYWVAPLLGAPIGAWVADRVVFAPSSSSSSDGTTVATLEANHPNGDVV